MRLEKSIEDTIVGILICKKDFEDERDIAKHIIQMLKDDNNLALPESLHIEQVIDYIEQDAEIAIPVNRFFDEDGEHITKKKYGHIVLEILCEELKEKFKK